MDVKILYHGRNRGTQAVLIDELAVALNDEGLNCKIASSSPKAGEKGDVPTALLIAGLAVQSVGLLVNVLTFYFNRRPSYTVTLKRGKATCTIGNLSERAATKMLAESTSTEDIEIQIIEGK